MEYIEYGNVVDKAEWPRGLWDSEPDKVQWQDKETGLPCIALRNGSGVWCGYVGVVPGHPLYRCDYSDCPKTCGQEWCDHRPEHILNVHGGITFAGSCTESDQEAFYRFRTHFYDKKTKADAERYPRGDSARWLKEWAFCADSFDAWQKRRLATMICHIPGQGEPDDVWWFGFDCAHLYDYCPAHTRYLKGSHHDNDVYRTLDYAKAQCADLAKQLKALS